MIINWKFLKGVQEEFCVDLVKDSTEVLKWLEDINRAHGEKNNINGFSWDFSGLYDNLTPSLVKEALLYAIRKCRGHWDDKLVSWIMDLVSFSLESSFVFW